MVEIKTFAFLDLETTDLPCNDNNTTKIIEISLITVQTNHLFVERSCSIKNKLSLCFNPRKMICSDTERMTNLSNADLENAAPFSADTVSMIVNFLNHNPKPICLVAHNGNRFDYPILRTEISKTGCKFPDDILCIDSLLAFRVLEKQEPVQLRFYDLDLAVFEDGYNKMLCKAVDEYESKGITRIKFRECKSGKSALCKPKIHGNTRPIAQLSEGSGHSNARTAKLCALKQQSKQHRQR